MKEASLWELLVDLLQYLAVTTTFQFLELSC